MHLYSWSPRNLGNILKVSGFKVIEFKLFISKWIPFRYRLKIHELVSFSYSLQTLGVDLIMIGIKQLQLQKKSKYFKEWINYLQ